MTKSDPLDKVRTKHHSKVHTIQLQAGVKYQFDLTSGNGKSGPQNPGFFDVWLRLEDGSGKVLANELKIKNVD